MPTSNLACAPEVIHLAHQVEHRSILDVGPGRGKYGVLLREYLAGVEIVDCVEAWEPYVTPMLRAIYDEVIQQDVMLVDASYFDEYDVVLMVDVIEHLTKDDALELLDRIPGRVVICTPIEFFQNPEADEIWSEAHRSHWTVDEFAAMPRCEIAYGNGLAVIARLGPGR